ncbi:MAG: hypothetical protein IPG17_12730 [Sandaracinaceae bacterium]|jgi:hypothetical protein|nr:hypothetical protein [Sandaracinaceae bacterium]MBK7153480.1 hypothetical protein [Sandaracinaceae bacterium]MBK7772611.1 hypothetical protein [Sandaracinaceae bacterium]MBK8406819.1 hypothetical protein [Sandaracinaceae bacterium]MBP7680601.1 hypothetical protein [Deltaproteobacteria bacterium]
MPRTLATPSLLLLAVSGAVCLLGTPVRAQRCPEGNVLADARIVAPTPGSPAEVLHDGRGYPEGTAWNAHETLQRRGTGPIVVFDLGENTRIRSAVLQGDSNDTFALSTSLDGERFEGVWAAPPVLDPPFGLRVRASAPFDVVTRFVRIDTLAGDGLSSLSEVQVFCAESPPSHTPFSVVTAYRTDPRAVYYRTAITTKAAAALLAIFLLALLRRYPSKRVQRAAFAVALVWSAFAFTDLGYVQGGGRTVHPTDSFHYFMGPKYFPELGYFDLYECLAKAERENGHGDALSGYYIRNLRSNQLRPLNPDGSGLACPDTFTDARWDEFKRDLELYRPFFPPNIPTQRMLADHGYNGTPITTTFHRLFVSSLSATPTHVQAMTMLDALSNLLAALLIGLSLGPTAGILAALTISSGEPWGYQWVGGSIGRANFVLWLGVGIALAARRKEAWSAAALTMAALFRLFPAVFVGAVGLRALMAVVQKRRLEPTERNVVLAAFGTLAVGVLVAGATVGFDAFGDWYLVMKRHAVNPPGNHLGLPLVLHYQPGVDSGSLLDARLSNPLEVWELRLEEIRFERLSLHVLGVLFAFGVLITAIRRGATQVETIGFGAIVLYSLLAITNYDGVWLIALVPLVHRSPARIAALLGFLASTQLLALVFGALEPRCLAQSVLLYALIVYVSLGALREIGARGADPAGIATAT